MRTLLALALLTACGPVPPPASPQPDMGGADAAGCEEWTIPADGDCPWQTIRQCGTADPVCVRGCDQPVPEYCSRA
jgi:hypothetical protein